MFATVSQKSEWLEINKKDQVYQNAANTLPTETVRELGKTMRRNNETKATLKQKEIVVCTFGIGTSAIIAVTTAAALALLFGLGVLATPLSLPTLLILAAAAGSIFMLLAMTFVFESTSHARFGNSEDNKTIEAAQNNPTLLIAIRNELIEKKVTPLATQQCGMFSRPYSNWKAQVIDTLQANPKVIEDMLH